MLQPVIPDFSNRALQLFDEPNPVSVAWSEFQNPPIGRKLRRFETLFERVKQASIEAMRAETMYQ